jgi:cytochrome d ubiquinol oxidase subunit I
MGAFFVLSISAWYILRKKHVDFARRSFGGALLLATLSSLAIAISGHGQAQNVYRYQPAKLATFEGHFDSQGPADLTLFGIPDAEGETVHMKVAIPGALSLLVHDDLTFSQPVLGLDRIRPKDRPPLWVPFLSWRLMVGVGTFFIGLTLYSWILWWRGVLFERRWLMWIYVGSVGLAVLANQVGWVAAEVGRQPWIVHPEIVRDDTGKIILDADGFVQYAETTATRPDGTSFRRVAGLRTDDGVSKAVEAEQVAASIAMFLLIYLLLGAVWLYVLNQKIQAGPDPPDEGFGTSRFSEMLELAGRRGPSHKLADTGVPKAGRPSTTGDAT